MTVCCDSTRVWPADCKRYVGLRQHVGVDDALQAGKACVELQKPHNGHRLARAQGGRVDYKEIIASLS